MQLIFFMVRLRKTRKRALPRDALIISFKDAEEGLYKRWRVNGHNEASEMRSVSPTSSYSEILFYGLALLRLPDLKEFKRKRNFLVPVPDFQQINEVSIN